MQLILLLALALLCTKKNGGLNEEAVQLIKTVSGDGGQIDEIMKEVREISELVTALSPAPSTSVPEGRDASRKTAGGGFPLAPIADIADERAYGALAGAIAAD